MKPILFALMLLSSLSACRRDAEISALLDKTQPDSSDDNSVFTDSATLTWEAPSIQSDATHETDLAGYMIRYGTKPGVYTQFIKVEDPASLRYTVNHLPAGQTYYFAVTAVSTSGIESEFSNEVSKAVF
ncbi:MAG: hypothetical protein A2X94_10085 [Bdellovibrionales bacterium GWB1_55_8]|nr:MAG: hypothetical protein A2X94_10085 [Bdellovibrionales bacterium GWB1_55_8]